MENQEVVCMGWEDDIDAYEGDFDDDDDYEDPDDDDRF